jgi:hypothetical protein
MTLRLFSYFLLQMYNHLNPIKVATKPVTIEENLKKIWASCVN